MFSSALGLSVTAGRTQYPGQQRPAPHAAAKQHDDDDQQQQPDHGVTTQPMKRVLFM